MNHSRRHLVPNLFMTPTPAGAVHVVTTPDETAPARLVRFLLRTPDATTTDDAAAVLAEHVGIADAELVDAIADAQGSGWLEGRSSPLRMPQGPLGIELPGLLAPLAQDGRALLIDDQGFMLAATGFSNEAAGELTVLAAEIARIEERRSTGIAFHDTTGGWGFIDSRGVPSISICPLTIGAQPFALILGGFPRLRQEAFVVLIGALSRRYADAKPVESTDPSLQHTTPMEEQTNA